MYRRFFSMTAFTLALLSFFSLMSALENVQDPEDAAETTDLKNEKDKGRISLPATSAVVAENDSIIIPCGIEGTKFALVWFKDNQNNTPLFVDDEKVNKNEFDFDVTKEKSLVIRRVHSKTVGEYTCFARPNLFTIHTVSMKVSVDIENVPSSVEVGGKLHLYCKVNGYPAPMVVWRRQKSSASDRKNWEIIGKTAIVDIPSVNVLDSGVYECMAHNSENQPPVSKSIQITVVNGLAAEYDTYYRNHTSDEAKLCCIYKWSNSNRLLPWMKDNQELILSYNSRMHVDTQGKSKVCLTITKMKDDDLGTYTCRMLKSENTVEKASMKLTGAPEIPQLESVGLDEISRVPVLKWRVKTYYPLLAYKIYVRKQGDDVWSSYADEPILSTDKEEIIEQKFNNLSNGQYNVKLNVQNKHNYSEYVSTDSPLIIDKFETNKGSDDSSAAATRNYCAVSSFLMFIIVSLWVLC